MRQIFIQTIHCSLFFNAPLYASHLGGFEQAGWRLFGKTKVWLPDTSKFKENKHYEILDKFLSVSTNGLFSRPSIRAVLVTFELVKPLHVNYMRGI